MNLTMGLPERSEGQEKKRGEGKREEKNNNNLF